MICNVLDLVIFVGQIKKNALDFSISHSFPMGAHFWDKLRSFFPNHLTSSRVLLFCVCLGDKLTKSDQVLNLSD